MAAPVWQSTTTATSGGATSLAVSKPASVAAGDLLVAHLTVRNIETLTQPTGFTVVKSMVAGVWQSAVAVRVADGTEGATFTWAWTSSTKAVSAMTRVTGAHQTSPVNVVGATGTIASTTTTAAPSVTTTVDDCLLFGFGVSADNNSWTAPAGMTERYDTATTNFGDCSHCGNTETLGVAGVTGTRTHTRTGSEGTAFLVAIAPPPPSVFTQSIGLTIFGA